MRAKRQEDVRDGPRARGWRSRAFHVAFGKKVQGAPSLCLPSFVSCHSDIFLLSMFFFFFLSMLRERNRQADKLPCHDASSAHCKSDQSFYHVPMVSCQFGPRWRESESGTECGVEAEHEGRERQG